MDDIIGGELGARLAELKRLKRDAESAEAASKVAAEEVRKSTDVYRVQKEREGAAWLAYSEALDKFGDSL